GNMALTALPASWREVIAVSSTSGCCASSRSSSTPVYPVPPTMPALIMCSAPETKSRPEAAFELSGSPPRWPGPDVSAFRVLLAPPRLVQADLFSLDFSRIARHEACRAERRLERRVELDERAREAVAYRAGLAVLAAAVHVDLDVEGRQVLGDLERLAHDHAAGLAGEEFVHGLAVDHEQALAGFDEHARGRALAPARAVVVITHHVRSPMLSVAAPCAGASRRRKSSA